MCTNKCLNILSINEQPRVTSYYLFFISHAILFHLFYRSFKKAHDIIWKHGHFECIVYWDKEWKEY